MLTKDSSKEITNFISNKLPNLETLKISYNETLKEDGFTLFFSDITSNESLQNVEAIQIGLDEFS
jgi:hypothetical protein